MRQNEDGSVSYDIGDRVYAIRGGIDGNKGILGGMTGTVICDPGLWPGVRFDVRMGGHNLNGKCKHGYGWWVVWKDLSPVPECGVDEEDPSDVPDALEFFFR